VRSKLHSRMNLLSLWQTDFILDINDTTREHQNKTRYLQVIYATSLG